MKFPRPVLRLLGLLLFLPALAQVSSDGRWRWQGGEAPTPANWQTTAFDDSLWAAGIQPLHSDFRSEGSRLTGFSPTARSVRLRQSFTAANAPKIGELLVRVLAEDGFVLWLNGQEVARYNVPEGALDSAALALNPAASPLTEETFAVATPSQRLVNGTNVLAVQLFTAQPVGDADFFWNATLAATVDNTAPAIVAQIPPAGSTVDSLAFSEVIFSEDVTGVEAADLKVNGVPATNVVQIAPGHYRFDFAPAAPGAAVLSFEAGHGIDDGLAAPNVLAPAAWSVTVDPSVNRHAVVLSEVVADNYRSLMDEDRDYPDWIELANLGDSPVDLRGWALTDDPSQPFKWRFGTASLGARGYLVVYASQKNKTNVTARTRLHTNFKLANEGEYLALVAPDGEVISEFAPKFPALGVDVAFGRLPDAPGQTGFFATPTPNARNASSGTGFAPEVSFSAPSGTYLHEFRLKLTAPGTSTVIRYTLNGTVPTNTSPAYTEPLILNGSLEVRARAFADGLLPGPIQSAGYIRLTNDPAHLAQFTSTLPILVMSTLRTATIAETRNTMVQFSLHEPVDGRSSLLLPPTFVSRGAAKVRGSSSASLPKTPYAIEWWDEFNEDRKEGILGLPADSEWVLYAPNQYDPGMLHNPFVHQLSRDLGQYSPRTRFVELYVQRNSGLLATNQWMGVYVLEEKPAIDSNRLAIDKLQPEDVAEPEVTGGYLMKFDRLDPADGGITFGSGTAAAVDPKEPELESPQRAPQLAYIKKYLGDFSRAQTAFEWRDPVTGYLPYIDLTNWVDYHIVEVLSGNVDSLVLSAYFHKERGGPLKWGPHWDFDRALGSTDGRDVNPKNWTTGPFFSATWWGRILRDPTAWQLWVDRYQEFRAGVMSRTNMNRLIDELAAQVAPIQPRESKKWSFMRPRGGTYTAEVNVMKNWLSNRVAYFDSQMAARPTLSSSGGRVEPGHTVTLSRPAGSTVYYTLDGIDPRRAYGTNELAPGALLYIGPITINANSRLVARARDLTKRQTGGPLTSTPWSGAIAATFTVTPPPLALTEIMFHPAKPTTAAGPDEDEFEFLELRNISGEKVALPGYRLSGGADYAFTADSGITELLPGGRVLLVANAVAFASRYPGVGPIAGEYSGRLGNGGARLALTGPLLEPVFDFEFNDRWQLLADGSGFSLARTDDGTVVNDPARPESWRLSGRFGGSPGEADPAPEWPQHRAAPVHIGELFTTAGDQNFIELEFAGTDAGASVNVSGWWLSNERDDWRKFRLPAGSVVTAANRVVVRQSQFDQPDGEGFQLDPLGGEVWLFSADAAGELTGFVAGGNYPASERGRSLTSHPQAGPEQAFVAASGSTPGAANSEAATGPLIVRTVAYASSEDDADAEFVEVFNRSNTTVELDRASAAPASWRLRGGIEFDFPAGSTLAEGRSLLVVGFDPVAEPAKLREFEARFRPATGTPILGPWHGRLANDRDTVRLQRLASLLPEDSTNIYFVDVDTVAYQSSAPWPVEAALSGKALLRRTPSPTDNLTRDWGSDPASWVAGWPTPGHGDRDLDGLPDSWEAEWHLDPNDPSGSVGTDGDPDADGFTNRMEFVNRTDPRDATDALRPAVLRGARGNLVLQLAAPAGKTITLQRASSLAPEGWLNVRSLTSAGMATTAVAIEETDTEGRFYRLVSE